MRAFAVEVNEHTGVSGFILPDHRVDVVQNEPGPNGKIDAETILQDVLVLASGQVFTRPEDRSIQSRTVTLAVTPEQVDILVAASAKGALSLALRGLNDHVARPKKVKIEPKPEPKPEPKVIAKKAAPPVAPKVHAKVEPKTTLKEKEPEPKETKQWSADSPFMPVRTDKH
jgi:pilus assembly protein CpaB